MDRLDYYFRQKVTEAELDDGFAKAEAADWNMVVDADLTGIHYGLACSEQAVPNMTVLMTAGAAYDATGRRIRIPANQNVNCAADYNGISTTVANPGNERWLSIFVGFGRNLTDARTDGNGATVYFSRAETFETRVVAGVEAASGLATRPSLDAARILVADVLLINGQTSVLNADISTTRRQDTFVAATSPLSLRKGRAKEAVSELLSLLASHVNSATAHGGASLSYGGGGAWADGTTNPATTVEGQLDKIVSDLASAGGAAKVYADASAASYHFGLAAGTLASQLDALRAYVDAGPLGTTSSAINANTTLTTERQVYADTSGGAVTLVLPAPTAGRVIFIKDVKGTFGTNALTVEPHDLAGANVVKIEGVAAARTLIADWGSYRFHSDGTDWFID
jgi:hypothetical protein